MAENHLRSEPLVDVVIAVHTPSRPIERAVASVLDHTAAPVRVTVVVHNTEPYPITAKLVAYQDDPRLRIVCYEDGIQSPAGPMNHGFDIATSRYVSLLGSDDMFEPGAIDQWLRAADLPEGSADMVIAPTRDAKGRFHPSPPIRWTRYVLGTGRPLDPVRDRLGYRSAPLGLIGRERFAELRLVEGLQTGEDQPFSSMLWFSRGSRVVFPVYAPGYRELDDQLDRVTFTPRSVQEEFRVLYNLLDPANTWMKNPSARLSLIVKFIRVHYFDAVQTRLLISWDLETARQLASVGRQLLEAEPRSVRLLARADEALLNALLDSASPVALIQKLCVNRTRIRSCAALLPRKLRYTLHSQSPLRTHLAGAILLWAMNRRKLSR